MTQKKISNLKRKRHKQDKHYAQSCKEKDLENQELKQRERHHTYVFRNAFNFFHTPHPDRYNHYTSWDKEVATRLDSAYHELAN